MRKFKFATRARSMLRAVAKLANGAAPRKPVAAPDSEMMIHHY